MPTYPSPKPTLSYICYCLLSALLFPARFFFFRIEYSSHDVSSSLDLSKDSHIVINISRIMFTVLISSVIVKRSSSGLASNWEEAMMTETEFIHLIRRWFPTPFCLFTFAWRPRKKCARVTRDGTICARNIAFGFPITGKGIQLQSPTPIMALACQQTLLFGQAKWLSRERGMDGPTLFPWPSRLLHSLVRSRKTHFTRPNRRACSEAITAPNGIWKGKEFALGAEPPAYTTLLSTSCPPSPPPSPCVSGLKAWN